MCEEMPGNKTDDVDKYVKRDVRKMARGFVQEKTVVRLEEKLGVPLTKKGRDTEWIK